MREVEWDHFDYLQDRISLLNDEADFYIDLLSNKKLVTDTGELTDEGMATAGMHGQKYNVYMVQADKYADEAAKMSAQMAADPYNTDLIARRDELLQKQRECILAAEDEKQAIADLVKEGLEAELDSMRDLVDGYTDALDAAKDYHDYVKRVSDHVDKIGSLEKQLSAYKDDDSEETRAKLQKLRVELEEERENLQETQYDKYVSDQKKLLDDMLSRFEATINSRMDNVDALVSDMINQINLNASDINATLVQTGTDVGYTMTSEMEMIWGNATNSINSVLTMYGTDFLSNQTTVISAINGISSQVAALISATNSLAQQRIQETTTTTEHDTSVKVDPTPTTKVPVIEPNTSSDKTIAVGKKINAGNAKIYDYIGTAPETQIFKDDPIYTVLQEKDGWIQVRYHKLSSGVTGWFRKSDVKAYKTGGIVDETGMAWLDGTKQNPEMVLNAQDTQNFLELNDYLRTLSSQGLSMREASYGYTPNGMTISHGIGADISSLASRVISDNGDSVNNAESAIITFGDINIAIDHVENYDDFVTKLQHDSKFEQMMQSMTIDRLAGKSSLAKNKFKWNR